MRVVPIGGLAVLAANLAGAAVVFVFLAWIVPLPQVPDDDAALTTNVWVFAITGAIGVPLGAVWSLARAAPALRWLPEDREPAPAEVRATLRTPLRLMFIQVTLWSAAGVVFLLVNLQYGRRLAIAIFITIVLGAAVTVSLAYLLLERIIRPVTRCALAAHVPDEPARPGVAMRVVLTWAAGTGAPLLGLALIAGAEWSGITHTSADRLAASLFFLAGIGLLTGLAGIVLAARSVADPIEEVRHAVGAVGAGRTDVHVPVTDGSEVGLLQAGFNRMVGGLRERERLRDLFGRQVGEDVARLALERGVELGGEDREVAVLFIDLVGSTRLAAERPPGEVVALLNDFFGAVVEVVTEHGGAVNKFEGDAALCVFGAPLERDDAAGDALAAARALCDRLREALPQADFGIGVSAGEAVAGNIGAAERFEYTVIGDPVNEASRLTELAKADGARVLASDAALERAREQERGRWAPCGEPVQLRGRTRPTHPARPRR